MADCCQVETHGGAGPARCPDCGQPSRAVEPITVRALLKPAALARLSGAARRFCPTASCPVVYFGEGEAFERGEMAVPVFQKEPPGDRTVCYCFAISEAELRREIAETGRSTAARRITAHVQAGRCACEVRNPQGSCCLGNVAALVAALHCPSELARPLAGLYWVRPDRLDCSRDVPEGPGATPRRRAGCALRKRGR